MNGTIFNIQRFCTNDGPGIRTTVFFKGCPLSCLWCHNPESQRGEREILFYKEKCSGCGRCKEMTVEDTDFLCYNDAKRICGKSVTVTEVLEEVLKDRLFYENSGGGLTLSGGEPLAQPAFAAALLKGAKEAGLHTAIETCGFTSERVIREIAPVVDLFLFDFKETNPTLHKQFTGVDNARILENLRLLDSINKESILRCPIIPGCNDRPEHYEGICRLANELRHLRQIEIEPYHSLGEGKYAALGKPAAHFDRFTDEQVQEIIQTIQNGTAAPVKKA
ncbi:MAG: glycyl-radical enzyme activating protein [Ruminococcaceae bacterium]|nr:glycyl-radical enzyme activating protein [Oscillospiraceae bacterium]